MDRDVFWVGWAGGLMVGGMLLERLRQQHRDEIKLIYMTCECGAAAKAKEFYAE